MPTGRVKILDFGLARSESEEAGLTQTGIVVGTPAYMAPEQARGEAVDHRADLFSLGCVLYRMLAGSSPFRGKSTLAILTALVEHSPPSLRSLGLQIPAALDDLVQQLLAKNPKLRPQSAIEVAAALAAIEAQLNGGPSANVAARRSASRNQSLVRAPVSGDVALARHCDEPNSLPAAPRRCGRRCGCRDFDRCGVRPLLAPARDFRQFCWQNSPSHSARRSG